MEQTSPTMDIRMVIGMMHLKTPRSQTPRELPARVSKNIAGSAYAPDKSPRDAMMAATCRKHLS